MLIDCRLEWGMKTLWQISVFRAGFHSGLECQTCVMLELLATHSVFQSGFASTVLMRITRHNRRTRQKGRTKVAAFAASFCDNLQDSRNDWRSFLPIPMITYVWSDVTTEHFVNIYIQICIMYPNLNTPVARSTRRWRIFPHAQFVNG